MEDMSEQGGGGRETADLGGEAAVGAGAAAGATTFSFPPPRRQSCDGKTTLSIIAGAKETSLLLVSSKTARDHP